MPELSASKFGREVQTNDILKKEGEIHTPKIAELRAKYTSILGRGQLERLFDEPESTLHHKKRADVKWEKTVNVTPLATWKAYHLGKEVAG